MMEGKNSYNKFNHLTEHTFEEEARGRVGFVYMNEVGAWGIIMGNNEGEIPQNLV